MITTLFVLALLSSACGLTGKALDCSNAIPRAAALGPAQPVQAMGDKFVEFDWAISKALNAVEKGNIVISPISLKVVLAMLYEGARGQTATEIRDALDLNNSTSGIRDNTRNRFSAILRSLQTSKGEYEIKMGTHVFIDKTAKPKLEFQCKLQQYYDSAMESVDFSNSSAAVSLINEWASNVTEGHIQHLVSEAEASSSTIMLLLNAVYFKGLWQVPFPENQTASGLFHTSNGRTVQTDLMNITETFDYYNMTEVDAQIVKLPYMGNKFSMYIILPNKKNGLERLVQSLGPNKYLRNIINNMTMTTVNIVMPKFEFDFTTSLRPTLEKLNIKRMFSPQAELTDIANTNSGGLVVSNVLQKAGISVTEIGTVAYAATVVEISNKFGGEEEVVPFRADHSFLFFIEDQTVQTTVFVGKVTNPETVKVDNKLSETPPPAQPAPADTSSANRQPEDRFQDQEGIQARLNHFDADLLKELGTAEEKNFVVSPASIKTLLALVLEAAEGSTQTELFDRLRVPDINQARKALSSLQKKLQKISDSKVTLDSYAQVFLSKTLTLNTTFAKTIKDYYLADMIQSDFSSPDVAANQINSWIRTQTKGLIDSLVEEGMIERDTVAILTSAIYFDGKWKNEFPLQDSRESCFYPNQNQPCQKVQMMSKNEELLYKYDPTLDSHVVKIPYQDEKYSMVIVLPRKMDGIKRLTIDAGRLQFPSVLQNITLYDVNLKMPRFSMEFGTQLEAILKKMGINEVFSEKANLPNMVNNMTARISAIVHKAKIQVSEKGTKAAAASGASVVPLMYGLETINLEVNHPFYYFIYEQESQTVLFAGRMSSAEGTKEVLEQVPSGVEPLSAAFPHSIRPTL